MCFQCRRWIYLRREWVLLYCWLLPPMPFFPNTGDSQVRVEDLKGELESAESRSKDLENLVAKLHEASSVEEALFGELTETLRQVEEMKNDIQDLQNQLAQSVSASREQELEQQLASAQKALQDAEAQVQTIQKTQSELTIPHLDIVICLDVTGSMRDQIEGLKREISSLAEVLDRISPSVGIGIVALVIADGNVPYMRWILLRQQVWVEFKLLSTG